MSAPFLAIDARTYGIAADASVRSFDPDGRMRVKETNICKAAVNDYRGAEIPNYVALGLDANRVYRMFRDPNEIAKAIMTANDIPLLRTHVHATAEKPHKDDVIGSVGSLATFDGTHAKNSLVIWDADEIAAIKARKKCELSPAYRYVPVMKPGDFQGLQYDGVMTQLHFSHVALVREGRQGPDVRVFDEKPKGERMKLISRAALMMHGAAAAILAPLLAADEAVDLAPVFDGVTAANFTEMRPKIAERLTAATSGKMAEDAKTDSTLAALDAVHLACDEDDDEIGATDSDDGDDDDDDAAKAAAAKKAKAEKEKPVGDRKPNPKPKPGKEAPVIEFDQAAMDAAINTAASERVAAALAERDAIDVARRAVRPFVGELDGAYDAAPPIYKLALDAQGVDLKGVPPEAYVHMVRTLRTPGADAAPTLAADSAVAAKSVTKRFPGLANISRS